VAFEEQRNGAGSPTNCRGPANVGSSGPDEIIVHPDQMSFGVLLGTPLEPRPTPDVAHEAQSAAPRGTWRVVALADLHLDTPFAWAPDAVGRLRRLDLRDALVAAVDLAAEVGADALLLASDLYEHERLNPDTAAFLERVLNGAEVPVLVSPGNHDWLAPSSVWATASWDDHVHIFDGQQLERFEVGGGLSVWGAAHHRPAGTAGFLDNAKVSGPGVNLGLFHGSEVSGMHYEGRDEAGRSKQPHAPFEAALIPEVGLDHAVVGHFHRRREGTHHTYPGNPVALAFGEPGDGGAVVLDIGLDGRVHRQWHRVSARPMTDLSLDVTGCADASAIVSQLRRESHGLTGLLRITVTGELAPGVTLVDSDLAAAVADSVDHSVVRRKKLFVGYDLDLVGNESSVRGEFVRSVLSDDQLDDDLRRDVISTGLRALVGRDDLDVAR